MSDQQPHDGADYTRRLVDTNSRWKRLIGAQVPYRWNIRRIVQGRVLEVGCGVGRNLLHLGGDGIGVDSNRHSVEVARLRGLAAYTTGEFPGSEDAATESYGTLVFAHVLEHMTNREAIELVDSYLGYLEPGGRVVVIVPQEAGFASDATHVEPVDEEVLRTVAGDNRLEVEKVYSFPLPRRFGRVFKHNETVALLRKPV